MKKTINIFGGKSMKKKIFLSLIIVISLFLITGCGSDNTKSENFSNNKEEITNDNTKSESSEKDNNSNSDDETGKYVYMFNRTQRMKLGSEPSKYGEYYSTAEEAMKIYGYDMTISHKLENGKIVSSDVGFKYNGKIYYINGQDSSLYESNKKKLKDIFGVENCSDGKTFYQCKNDTISVNIWQAGGAETNVDREYCHSGDDFAKCGTH